MALLESGHNRDRLRVFFEARLVRSLRIAQSMEADGDERLLLFARRCALSAYQDLCRLGVLEQIAAEETIEAHRPGGQQQQAG